MLFVKKVYYKHSFIILHSYDFGKDGLPLCIFINVSQVQKIKSNLEVYRARGRGLQNSERRIEMESIAQLLLLFCMNPIPDSFFSLVWNGNQLNNVHLNKSINLSFFLKQSVKNPSDIKSYYTLSNVERWSLFAHKKYNIYQSQD